MIYTKMIVAFLMAFIAACLPDPNSTTDQYPSPSFHRDSIFITKLNADAAQLIERQQFDSAQAILKEVFGLSQKKGFPKGTARAQSHLTRIHYMKGDYVKSVQYGLRSLSTAKSINDPAEIAYSKNNLALVYLIQGNKHRAIQEFRDAAVLNKQLGNQRGVAANYFNIGLAYSESNDFKRAKAEFERSKFLSKKNNIHHIELMATNRLAELYFKAGHIDSARSFYTTVVTSKENSSDWEKSFAHTGLAKCLSAEEHYSASIKQAAIALKLAKKIGTKWDIEQALDVIHHAYAELGDYTHAYYYLHTQKLYSDSLIDDKKIKLLDSTHFANQKAVNESLLKEKKIAEQESDRSILIAGFATLSLFLTLFFSIVIYRKSRRLKSVNQELEEQAKAILESEQQLKQQNKIILEQNEKLNHLNDTKNNLFSIIAHDVRAPFSMIIGLLDLLENSHFSEDEMYELHKELNKHAQASLNMVNNLLHWSTGQQQGFFTKFTTLSLERKMQEVLSVTHSLAIAKGIYIFHENTVNPFISADRDHVKIILHNIIVNAIKFTKSGGFIRITYDIAADTVSVNIRDNGIGMSADQVEKLLHSKQSFVSTPGTENESGVGLGMMLVQLFIAKNNAQFDIQSEEGKGTNFKITFLRDTAIESRKYLNN